MAKEFKRILVTAALPYANGPVHIGHLAGCYLPADIYVRFQRAQKKDVKFICGTDEHGVPITIRAKKEKVSPQEIVDQFHELIKESFNQMGISFDIFSRTTNEKHRQTAQAFFLKLYHDGLFEEKITEQYYDEQEKMFLADRYIIGTCPVCGNKNAYGDQCENCGSTLSPEQLIHPKSALSNSALIKKETKHWYFPLNEYEAFLKKWIIEGKKEEWKANVYGQCKSWLDNGLQSRAMTRDGKWGIQVPLEDAEGKVLYVWFDAPIGYISATKELLPQGWDDYWKKEDTKLIQFIGKDNIVFHCIIFPSMLKAHGGYILPENVPANEFLNIEGEKVSTSRNWAVWVHEYIADFPEMQDTLRYVLCANAPETKDNDFTWKDFQDRNNNELVAILGNFINRAMVLMHKLCKGRVPNFWDEEKTDLDLNLIKALQESRKKVEFDLEHFKFRDALYEVIDLARKGNKYLQETAPWLLSKTPEHQIENQFKIDNCLHIALQISANIAIFCNPFMPTTAAKICHMLKVVPKMLEWKNAGRMDLLRINYPLRPPELLFRKVEESEIEHQREKLRKKSNAALMNKKVEQQKEATLSTELLPLKETITIEDFTKLDLRSGVILSAEKVEKTDKLMKLQIDLGFEQRTIVSGIAAHFQSEEIIGKQVIVVANLKPRKMRGILSEGMILMAEKGTGELVFIKSEQQILPGTTVK